MATSAVAPEWRDNGPERGTSAAAWLGLWRARDLILFFALRDIRVRYKQAALGIIWVLLQPIATVVVFTLVFNRLASVGSQGIPYPLFALVGTIVWAYFSTATLRGSQVLVNNPELVTKVSFPRMAAPAAAMLPPLVDVAVSMVLVVPMLAFYGVAPSWRVLATPVWLALVVLTAFGISLWLSALNVRYRDVQAALAPTLQVWLFASPVAYSSSALTGWREFVYALNPMSGLIGLARWSVLDAPWPGWSLAVSLSTSAAVLVSGLMYFRRAERAFADVI